MIKQFLAAVLGSMEKRLRTWHSDLLNAANACFVETAVMTTDLPLVNFMEWLGRTQLLSNAEKSACIGRVRQFQASCEPCGAVSHPSGFCAVHATLSDVLIWSAADAAGDGKAG